MRPVVFLIACVGLGGCATFDAGHAMRFELSRDRGGPVVVEHQSFFFWGLVPTRRVDVIAKCPFGVAAIVERTDIAGAASWIPTFGLWKRRTTTFYCRPAPSAKAPP